MGEVEVAVGCPHRLHAPIGPDTGKPCATCAAFGSPGWPRWAIAMTVDYGPRLSDAATAASPRVVEAPPPRPDVADRIRVWSDYASVRATPSLDRMIATYLAEGGVHMTVGDTNIEPQPVTEDDRRLDRVRFQITQEARLSAAVADRVADQQSMRLRIVPD